MLKQTQGVLRLTAADSPSHQAVLDARSALAAQRRELARQWLALPAEELQEAYAGPPGTTHRLLRASEVRYAVMSEADQVLLARLQDDLACADSPRSTIALLLAAMLYLEPHELPRIFPFEAVPPWLQEEYAKYMLTPPNFFRDAGEAEVFGRHMQRWVAYLHRGILGHPRDQLWVNIRNYALQALNFMFIYFNDLNLREMYRQRAEIFEFTLRSSGHRLDYVFPPRIDRPRLRLGILAAHYFAQTETFTTLPLYDYLDRREFEIILITTEANHSPLERYCISRADRFIPLPVVALPQGLPAQVQAIRDADLDLLIVGTNVTARTNPIALLAMHRLARIQIMHVSSCTTSGMSHMDYYLSGRLTERAEEAQDQYTERLLLIDGPAHCYDFATEQSPVQARTLTREQFGIPADATVFISGANCLKIIPELQDVWIRILRQTPGSWLLLYPFNPYWMSSYPVETLLQGFRAAAAAQGISDDRILVFAPAPNRAEVLERLRLADIYLDSFPFSGANSLLDPLEVGLPSVVMDGSTFRELMGAAMLRELQLEELAGSSPENYVELACRLAADARYRSRIRHQLQAAMQSKPKFLDPRWYAAQVARILSTVWAERSAVNFAPLTPLD
jgi:predicted O-linked N-acetylglucosamine transferase (SPINDLY family)